MTTLPPAQTRRPGPRRRGGPPRGGRAPGRLPGLFTELAAEARRLPGQVVDLFRFAAIRVWAKRRLFLGLQVGVVVAATVAATIPLYSNGALTRLLAAVLQPRNERPAGALLLRYLFHAGDQFTPVQLDRLQRLARQIGRLTGLGTTPPAFFAAIGANSFLPDPLSPVPIDPSYQRAGSLDMQVDLPEHIRLVAGRLYGQGMRGGVVEGIISTDTQQNLHMVLGQLYDYPSPDFLGVQVKVRIVGIYQRLNPGGPFWPYQYQNADVFIPPQVFMSHFMFNPAYPLEEVTWYAILRLNHLSPAGAGHLIDVLSSINTRAGQIMPHTQLAVSPIDELESFTQQLVVMQGELLLISLPILALTLYYVVMMAGLAVQQERNEIAILVSRGARTWQIVALYFAEWLILGGVAFLVAPFPAALLTEVVGASTGFLQFVNRQALPILPTAAMYKYEAAAALAAILAALLPVVTATRQSIISYRQETARALRAPFWRRAYLEFVLGAVVYYAWRQFRHIAAAQAATGAAAAPGVGGGSGGPSLAGEPLLYLVPALFMVASGLFVVRILPWLIRAVEAFIGRLAPVTFVLPARQLSRAPAQFGPLIFLLVFTVALGYYSASAARTLNRNLEDALAYEVGSDVSMYEVWAPPGGGSFGPSATAAGLEATGPSIAQFGGVTQGLGGPGAGGPRLVEEPPFGPNRSLPGVVSAARVFLEQATVSVGGQPVSQGAQLMGIDPVDFFHTAWWRSDLSPFTLVSYMNALLTHYNGVLVDQSFMTENALRPGDSLHISLGGSNSGSFEILGSIRYWPGMYPANGPLLVANWPYIENTFGVEPYYVWFRTRTDASDQAMVNRLQAQKLFPTQVVDRRVLLGQAHADPQWTGSNGLLTISFLVAALLTVLGYLLYAILSLRNRLLQFGLLRAMGLARSDLGVAVTIEQVFLIVAGVLGGLYVGAWASFLFLPFFQTASGGAVPPFLISGPGPDLARMGGLLALLLALAVLGLLQNLRGLRIGEAVKLGEE